MQDDEMLEGNTRTVPPLILHQGLTFLPDWIAQTLGLPFWQYYIVHCPFMKNKVINAHMAEVMTVSVCACVAEDFG